MTEQELQAIEQRWAKATPGPWHQCLNIDGVYAGTKTLVKNNDGVEICGPRQCRTQDKNTVNNAAAIANAPTDISALIAEVRRLQAAEKVCELLCQNAGMHCSAMGKCAECGKETVHALGLVCKSCIDKALRKWADGRNGNG